MAVVNEKRVAWIKSDFSEFRPGANPCSLMRHIQTVSFLARIIGKWLMGRILCPNHGKSPIVHVCLHLHDSIVNANGIGRAQHLRWRKIPYVRDVEVSEGFTVEIFICSNCQSKSNQTLVDEAKPVCAKCWSELTSTESSN